MRKPTGAIACGFLYFALSSPARRGVPGAIFSAAAAVAVQVMLWSTGGGAMPDASFKLVRTVKVTGKLDALP